MLWSGGIIMTIEIITDENGIKWQIYNYKKATVKTRYIEENETQGDNPQPKIMSRRELRQKLTFEELTKLDNAMIYPNLTDDQRMLINTVAKSIEINDYININDPEMDFMLSKLVEAGVITEDRKLEIME